MKAPHHAADGSTLATTATTVVGPRLRELEAVVERGKHVFLEVGRALLVIREERCYRERGFTSFEDYCQEHWGFSKTHANRLVDAADVAKALTPIGVSPATESVARELAPLKSEPAKVREAWAETVERHGDKPTAAQVREVVQAAVAPTPPADDPATSFFKAGAKAQREAQSELHHVREVVNATKRIDWDLLAGQVRAMDAMDRRLLDSSAALLAGYAREINKLLEPKLEVVK